MTQPIKYHCPMTNTNQIKKKIEKMKSCLQLQNSVYHRRNLMDLTIDKLLDLSKQKDFGAPKLNRNTYFILQII